MFARGGGRQKKTTEKKEPHIDFSFQNYRKELVKLGEGSLKYVTYLFNKKNSVHFLRIFKWKLNYMFL